MGVGLWLKLRVAAEQGGKGQDGWGSDLRPPNSPPSTHRASRARAAGASAASRSVSIQGLITNFSGMGDRGIPG